MRRRDWLYWVVFAIAGITVFSGLVQMVAPEFELRLLSVETTPTSAHLFATVGMFMVLFGGLILQALPAQADPSAPVLWFSFQKFGASVAVGIGVLHHVFSPLVLLVATFDLCSGI